MTVLAPLAAPLFLTGIAGDMFATAAKMCAGYSAAHVLQPSPTWRPHCLPNIEGQQAQAAVVQGRFSPFAQQLPKTRKSHGEDLFSEYMQLHAGFKTSSVSNRYALTCSVLYISARCSQSWLQLAGIP